MIFEMLAFSFYLLIMLAMFPVAILAITTMGIVNALLMLPFLAFVAAMQLIEKRRAKDDL